MSTSELSEIECWDCGETDNIVYGGNAEEGPRRCDNCGAVIAEAGVDTLTIPSDKEQSMSIRERHNEFTIIERVKRWLGIL